MSTQRLEALRRLEVANAVECVALMPGANLRYFTGLPMHPSERPTVAFFPVNGAPLVVLPELEAPGARGLLPSEVCLITYCDEEGHGQAFSEAADRLSLGGKSVGVESLAMRVLELRRIEQAAPGCRFVATEPWLPRLRMVKDEAELGHMRRAVQIAECALQRLLAEDAIRPGRSERDVAADLQVALLREGSHAQAFAPIVVSGPNSALPHASPSERILCDGDLVILDWGAACEGYQSDLTRTFVLGGRSGSVVHSVSKMESIYDAVLTANEAGRAVARAGLPAQEVDRAARRAIGLAGHAEHFIHRTGHGLGLETHEPPYLVEGNLDLLEPGMTFTVEPGIYVPGVGGVRIEDDVVVTEQGCDTLSALPRELTWLQM